MPFFDAPSPAVSDVFYPSELGFGAAPLGRLLEAQLEEGVRAVQLAVEIGITFFDVSPYYGAHRAEEVLGRGLQGRRDQVRICTKAGRFGDSDFDFSARALIRSLDDSLRRLKTDYVDVFLAHDIEHGPPEQILGETVETLLRLKDAGKCRSVGVSGYPLQVLRTVIERAPIDVVLSYCHYCLFNQRLASELLPCAERQGVRLINGSPLGMGLLSGRAPPPWHPAPVALSERCLRAAEHCRENGTSLARHALQFALSAGGVEITLTGMETKVTVRDNVYTARQPPDSQMQHALASIFAEVQGVTWQPATEAWRLASFRSDATVSR